jgi:5'-3' exonuclease
MSQISYSTIIVDCLNLLHRNWWPRRELKTSQGVYSGMEYGFLSGLLKIIKNYHPAKVFLVWDGQPTRCRTIFPEYKLQRQPIKERGLEPDWVPRIALLRDLLKDVFYTVYHPETEADEEIARITWKFDAKGYRTLVFSNDKDMQQLVTSVIHVCSFGKDEKENDIIYDYELMKAKWGVAPERIPLYRSFLGAGDVSDGIRGIPRFPTKLALEIVNQCSSIDQVLNLMEMGLADVITASQEEKIRDPENQKLVSRNYKLMELLTQKDQNPSIFPRPSGDLSKIMALCDQLEFRSIIDRPEWQLLGTTPGDLHAGDVSTGRSSNLGEV